MANQSKLSKFMGKGKEEDDEVSGVAVEDPYELPKEWKWVKLGDVTHINRETRNPAKERPNEEFRYIEISEVEEGRIKQAKKILGRDAPSRARRIVHVNDVIMSTVRPYLKAFAVVPEKYDGQVCSTGFAVLSSRNNLLPRYLLYTLLSDTTIQQCDAMMKGAHYPALRIEQVSQVKIPLPPFEEQCRIVARIEKFVNKIKEARRLKKIAKQRSEKVMQAALHKVFSRVKEKEWEKLGEVCKINPSKSEIKSLPDDTDVTFVPMTFVNETTGRIENPKVKPLGDVRKGYTYFKEGDVLFAKITPCMENGKSAVARNLVNGIGFGSTEFHVIRPLRDVFPEWVYFFIRQQSLRKEATRHFTGSVGQQRVPKKFLMNLLIPLPSLEIQEKEVTYLTRLKKALESLRNVRQKRGKGLEKLVPGILDKAFKGFL